MRKNIKIVIFDCDGVFSDGIYSVSSNGIVTKNFYTRDFSALEKLLKRGHIVPILTGSEDQCFYNKCSTNKFLMKYNNLFIAHGCYDKKEFIEKGGISLFAKGRGIEAEVEDGWENIAYMGDAGNDLECMKLAAISGCPCDAEEPIIEIADYVSPHKGGHGAIVDFVKYLLETNNE